MRYFLFCELKKFYVREWEKRDPTRVAIPLAVHRDKRVLDLNEPAHTAGVRTGMGLEEAKALLQGMGLVKFEEEPYREAQQQWLDVLTTYSSVVEPAEMHQAWLDLSGHADPFDLIAQLRSELLRTSLGTPQFGLAGNKWLARLAADVLCGIPLDLWPEATRKILREPAVFIAELPVHALSPVDPVHRDRLKFLGYRTIGHVAQIPLRVLRDQFGNESQRIHAAAKGGPQDIVRPLYPPDAVVARFRFPGGISDSEELSRGLERLSRSLAKRLSERESQSTDIEMRLETEAGKLERKRTFSRPIRTAREVLTALSRMVGEVASPIEAIFIRIPNLSKAKERQAGLFTLAQPGENVGADRALSSLRKVFGDHSVMRASEKVESRRVRVLRAWSHATGWK